MAHERRQSIRLHTRLVTTFVTVGGASKRQQASTRDVGGAGLCFVTEEELKPGTLLNIQLTLPYRDQPVPFVAEVVWNRPSYEGRKSEQVPQMEVGVRFVKINPEDRSQIVHFAQMSSLSQQD